MDQNEFLDRLKSAGYDAYVDDVVMIRIDPCVQSTADLRKFVRNCEWQRSWGMEMTRPDPLRKDSEPPRAVQKTNTRKAPRKAPPVDPAPAAGVKKSKPSRKGPKPKAGGKKEESPTESVPDIPGQMSIFDFLGGSGGG